LTINSKNYESLLGIVVNAYYTVLVLSNSFTYYDLINSLLIIFIIFEYIFYGYDGGFYNKLNKFLISPSCGINVDVENEHQCLHNASASK
jgi:hypothetical protein